MVVYFFFYGGSEVLIVYFIFFIFVEKWDIFNFLVMIIVIVYWIGMIIGRLLIGLVFEKLIYYCYFCIISVGGLAVFVVLVLSKSVWFGFVFCFFLGLFMVGMFVIVLIIINYFYLGKIEIIISILFVLNGLGGLFFLIVVGWSLDEYFV